MTEFKKFKIGSSYVIRGHEIKNGINGLFEILPTKKRINSRDAKVAGSYNYVSRGTTNNGIAAHIDYDPKFLNEGNTLSFAQDTAAIFYQDQPYFTGNKVNVLRLNSKYGVLKRSVALYLQAAIHSAFPDFTWGTLLNIEKIANTDILLPVTPSGDPDFAYMTRYIQDLEAQRIQDLDAYLKVSGLDNTALTDQEKAVLTKKVEWKKFPIPDIFNIEKGKRLVKAKQKPGKTPFIGSSSANHGITNSIAQDPIFPANTITISYNGSVGQVFYQDEPYWASDDINVLSLKPEYPALNKETANFFASCLKKAGEGFGYSMKWNVARMKQSDILLPVTSTGAIDFAYMQDYITALEKLNIKDVVAYKDKVIAATKQIVSQQS